MVTTTARTMDPMTLNCLVNYAANNLSRYRHIDVHPTVRQFLGDIIQTYGLNSSSAAGTLQALMLGQDRFFVIKSTGEVFAGESSYPDLRSNGIPSVRFPLFSMHLPLPAMDVQPDRIMLGQANYAVDTLFGDVYLKKV